MVPGVEAMESRLCFSAMVIGDPMLVNQTEIGNQMTSGWGRSMAVDAAGNYAVTWNQVVGEQANYLDVFARVFNADGSPRTNEFRVNTYVPGSQWDPTVAMDAAGNFVVCWATDGMEGRKGSALGVVARRFDAAGAPQGAEFLVNTYTAYDQTDPSVAMDDSGNFTIAWESWAQDPGYSQKTGWNRGIYAQRFLAGGARAGSEFRVNTYTAGQQMDPSVAVDRDSGELVIAWTSGSGAAHQDGDGAGVYAQRYLATGAKAGGEFRVNTYTAGNQSQPSVAVNAAGQFFIAWMSDLQDGSGNGIYGQRYNADGTPAAGEFRANTTVESTQIYPQVALSDAGDGIVTWMSGHTGTSSVYFQLYASGGAADGGETRVYGPRDGYAGYPTPAMCRDGSFLIGYRANDADNNGVYVQRYVPAVPMASTTTAPFATTNWTADDGEPDDEEALTLVEQVFG